VELALLAAAWAVGELIPLAPTAVAMSAIGGILYECTVKTVTKTVAKTVEDTVTVRVANALKRAVQSMNRIG
jgi:hypothetical protein